MFTIKRIIEEKNKSQHNILIICVPKESHYKHVVIVVIVVVKQHKIKTVNIESTIISPYLPCSPQVGGHSPYCP